MYVIVRPYKMVLVNKFRETCFVSVVNVSLMDISFFCLLLNVACLSSYKTGERLETSMHVSAHERCACSANRCVDHGYTAYWSMTKRLDIIEPHAVRQDPDGSHCVKDCLANRMPFRSMSDRTVPRVEPQVERQLVCTRTIRPRTNVYPRIVSPALLFCFSEE